MIKTYSKKADGSKNLSKNFKGYEFACKDGSDKYLVDPALVLILQKIRDHFKVPVIINSAYRTAAHNKKVGGATNSNHTKGTAADIEVKGIAPLKVAQYAESIGVLGIGWYKNFVHIDTRTSRYFWDQRSGAPRVVSTFGGTTYPIPTRNLKKGTSGNDVKWLQDKLGLTADGVFGAKTDAAVRTFQKQKGLTVDGVVGKNTRAALK